MAGADQPTTGWWLRVWAAGVAFIAATHVALWWLT